MRTPKAPHHSAADDPTPTEKPFEALVRGREEPTSKARTFKHLDPRVALSNAINTNVAGVVEPIVVWYATALAQVACIDIDVPVGGIPLPEHAVVAAYFPETLPRPLLAFRSHGGGLKAIFVAVGETPALDLAATWYLLAPLGEMRSWRAEVKQDFRHPRGVRCENGQKQRCGPLAWFAPSARVVLPKETAAEATEDEIAAWLTAHDAEMGRRSAANCVMPGCGQLEATSGSDPIDINERGVRCYRCNRFVGWGRLVHGAGGLSPLALAARERVHFAHQRLVLSDAHPHADSRLLRQGWWGLLHAAAGRLPLPDRGTPEREVYAADELPAFAAAMSTEIGLVRSVDGSWRQEGSLLRRHITTITARSIPWARTPARVDEVLDSVPLSGFKPVHPVNHGLLLPAGYRAPLDGLIVRRAPAPDELPAVDVSRRPSTAQVSAAWAELQRILPGLDRGYLSALIAAALRAHHPTGMPPIAVVTGGTGSGKNTTIDIAASAVGTRVAGCKLSDAKETLRDFGLALEEGSTIINLNEVGRLKDVYAKLEAILRIGKTIRYDAKCRNELTAPFTAGVIITGSTLPAAIVRGPEMARRAVGWRLTAPDGNWRKVGDLTLARHVPGVGGPLETATADIWWLLLDDQRPWDVLARERFGGVSISELDLEDAGAEDRDQLLRLLYETYRTVPERAFTAHRGGPGWLTVSKIMPAFRALANLIDVENAERARGAAHDLQRVELGPILGFQRPRFSILVARHATDWRLKVIQIDAPRGRGLPRAEWPAAASDAHAEKVVDVGALKLGDGVSRPVVLSPIPDEKGATRVTHVTQRSSEEEEASCAANTEEPGDATEATARRPEDVVVVVRNGDALELHDEQGAAGCWSAMGEVPAGAVQHIEASRVVVTSGPTTSALLREHVSSPVIVDALSVSRITGSRTITINDTQTLLDMGRRFLVQVPPSEDAVLEADRAVNARGFQIDIELARSLAELSSWVAMNAQVKAPVPVVDLMNPGRLRRVLSETGIELPDVQRATLEAALEDPDLSPDARTIIVARTATATNTQGKLAAALAAVGPDGRVRDTLVYAGASTGRWSGRGFQPQNLPHGLNANVELIVRAVLARDIRGLNAFARQLGLRSVAALLRGLMRSIIVARQECLLVKADFSQLEPRILAWLADDEEKLDRLRDPKHDLYVDLAAVILTNDPKTVTSAQRVLGKVGELGCSYGMGPARTEIYGAAVGIDWTSAVVSPRQVVDAWRNANPKVAGPDGLWEYFELALGFAAQGDSSEIGRVFFDRDGDDVLVELPSGRRVRYRKVRRESDGHGGTQITFERRGRRIRTWGAKLTENIVQAVGRDVHAEKLVQLEENGLATVLHVHDDVVVETTDPSDADAVEYLLTQPPAWAPDLPLAVTVSSGKRYT